MNALNIAINMVQEEIKNDRQYYENNEDETRNKLINPILQAIDWNISDGKKNVKTNFEIKYPTGGQKRGDYLLMKGQKKYLVIEAKNLGYNNIRKPIVLDQIIRYCDVVGVDYGLITNGLNWILINIDKIKKKDEGILWELNILKDDLDSIILKFRTISFSQINKIEEGCIEVKKAFRVRQIAEQKKQSEIERKYDTLDRSWKQFLKNQKEIVDVIFNLFDSCLNSSNVSRDKFTRHEISAFLKEKIRDTFMSEPIRELDKSTNKEEYQGTVKPAKLFIRKQEIPINDWNDVLIESANWLIDQRKIKKSDCPIKVSDRAKLYLINSEPFQKDGKKFRGKVELKNHLWITTNFNKEQTLNTTKKLFIKCKMPGEMFRVE